MISLAKPLLHMWVFAALAISEPRLLATALAAEVDAKGEATVKEAMRLYRQGLYEEAAKLFSGLAVDYPDVPIFERNLGACFYYMHKPEPALSNLRSYLNHRKDIAAEDRAMVEGWIKEMEVLKAQNAAAPAYAVPPAGSPPIHRAVVDGRPGTPGPLVAGAASPWAFSPAPPVPPESSPVPQVDAHYSPIPQAQVQYAPVPQAKPEGLAMEPPVATSPAVASSADSGAHALPPSGQTGVAPTTSVLPPAVERSIAPSVSAARKPLRIMGLASGVVGLASIATGIYFYDRAVTMSDRVSKATTWNQSNYQAGKDAVTLQWVFYGVGASALALGAILYILGRPVPATTPRISVAPTVAPGALFVTAQGGF